MACYGTVCSYTFTIHCTLYIRNENKGTKEGLFLRRAYSNEDEGRIAFKLKSKEGAWPKCIETTVRK